MNYKCHEYADLFPLMTGSEFVDLKADIKANGLLEPIWLYDGKILDGRNRFRACQEVGVDIRSEEYAGDDPLGFVISLNLKRRHLNESQRAMVAAKLANMKSGTRTDLQPSANLHEVSAAQAGDMLNVSERSVKTAKKVEQNATPELVEKVRQGDISVSAAADVAELPVEEQEEIVAKGEREILLAAKEIRAKKAEARHKERIQKIDEISKGNAELNISKTYPVIYADPPWRYEHSSSDNRQIENHYPTMELNEICSLPVNGLASQDSILFLWTTSPKLTESVDVMKAWGFDYRTCAVWDKQKIGMGYYFRQQHEILLVATKGNIPAPPVEARISSLISIDRGKHSSKPDRFYEIIEAMYPGLSKIELFCRSPREGWDVWGNQSGAA